MNPFLDTFGGITIYQIVVFFLAIGYAIDKGKRLYKWVTTRHDQNQSEEQQIADIVGTVKQHSIDMELLKQSNLATLNYHLFAECESVLERGQVTVMELDKIKRLYSAYSALGGNGTGTKLYNDVQSLPVKTITRRTV